MKKITNPILLAHSLIQSGILTLLICLALLAKNYSFLLCGIVPLTFIIIQRLEFGTGFDDDNS